MIISSLTQYPKKVVEFLLRQIQIIIPFLILIFLILVLTAKPDVVTRLQLIQFDQLQRFKPREFKPSPVSIVVIDEKSLKELGQWPWPRSVLADLVNKLGGNGAVSIGFDVVFAEPDRTSADIILANSVMSNKLKDELRKLRNTDDIFAEALSKNPTVTGYILAHGVPDGRHPIAKVSPAVVGGVGTHPSEFLINFRTAVPNLPKLEEASKGNGALNFQPSVDGVVRYLPLIFNHDDKIYLPLAVEVLRVALNEQRVGIKTAGASGAKRLGNNSGVVQFRIGQLVIPTDFTGRLPIYYSRNAKRPVISASDIISGKFNKADIAGHMILVGATASGLFDYRVNAHGENIAGVFAHAEAIEQIIHSQYIERPDWSEGAELFVLLISGLLVISLFFWLGAVWSAIATILIISGIFGGVWYAFDQHALLVDAFNPAIGITLVFLSGVIIAHIRSERQQKEIRNTFSNYVSKNLVDHLLEDPDSVKLGGERREITMMFTDLASFTSLAEQTPVDDLAPMLNNYLDKMIQTVFEYDGTLDKIIGDALVILFSAPLIQDDHAQRAVNCALAMEKIATEYREERLKENIPFGVTRMGINTGTVVVGNFGASNLFDYTAFGDAMNTAARIESVNKHLGTTMGVSQTTVDQCTNFHGRPIADLVLKGRSQDLRVFEPFTEEEMASQKLRDYMEFFQALEAGEKGMEKRIDQLIKLYPKDPGFMLHHKRLHIMKETGVRMVMDEK